MPFHTLQEAVAAQLGPSRAAAAPITTLSAPQAAAPTPTPQFDIGAREDALAQALANQGRRGPSANIPQAAFGALGAFFEGRENRAERERIDVARAEQRDRILENAENQGLTPQQIELVGLIAEDNVPGALSVIAEFADRDPEGLRTLSPDEATDLGFGPNAVVQQDRKTGELKLVNKSGALVKVEIPPGEEEFDKRTAINNANRLAEIGEERVVIRDQVAGLRKFEQILAQGVKTGFVPELLARAGRVTEGFGLEIGDVTEITQLQALGAQMSLVALDSLKGATSDRDIQIAMSTNPQTANTTEANLAISKMRKEISARKQTELDFESKFIRDNRRFPSNAEFEARFPESPFSPETLKVFPEPGTDTFISSAQAGDLPINRMSNEQLNELDPDSLTLEEGRAARQRWLELNRETL